MEAYTRMAVSEACHLLAVLFYDPRETLAEAPETLFADYEPTIRKCGEGLHDLYRELQVHYRNSTQNELRVDYAALFVGPFELLACPYGSVYLEKEYRLFGRTTEQVERLYHQAGLQTEPDAGFIPDHIAVELEFLHYLLSRGSANEDDQAAAVLAPFINLFFQPFAEALASRIVTHAQTEFYRTLGAMLAQLTRTLVICAGAQPRFAVDDLPAIRHSLLPVSAETVGS
jgi:TorA maturation chaperone TorD